MARKSRDFMLHFVRDLMDKTVDEADLIHSLRQIMRKDKAKNKDKGKNNDILSSYRYNEKEKNKHQKLLTSDSGESVLHIAVSCRRNRVAEEIVDCIPSLINCERKDDDYRGQTPFHIVIAMAHSETTGQQKLLEHMIKKLKREDEQNDSHLLKEAIERRVVGKKLRGTVMLGGTPLSIAALNHNENIVDLLLENKADLLGSNSFGNTVFHSLVLYVSFYPGKESDILNMFDTLARKNKQHKGLKYNRQYIQRENARKQTALHLAAELGLDNVFKHILDMEDAYKFFTSHDGVFDIYECDITEIDKVTWDEAVLQMSPDYRNTDHRAEGLAKGKEDSGIKTYWKRLRQNTNQSILEIICSLKTTTAYAFLNAYTVQEVVYLKWQKNWHYYYIGLFLHLSLMSILTWHLDLKVDAILDPDPAQKQTLNLRVLNIIFIVISLLYVILEIHRTFFSWQPFHITRLHHNGVYRCIFVLFGLALLTDASWNVVTVTNNYCLVIALILGWWSTIFFLRGISPFSYVTLMLQKVLFGDMLKFIPIIFIMMIAFTCAMYSSMAITQPDAFGNFSTSLVTMFKLMTGQAEIDGLEGASQHGSIPVFVFSVIVIQIFLLNILIAIMSRTCESVENSNKLLWLQRLSIVLFIEGILPKCLKKAMGTEQKTDYGSTRYLLIIDRLRDGDSMFNNMFEENGSLNATSLRNFINNRKIGEATTLPGTNHNPGPQTIQHLYIDDYLKST
ncbi:transient receptor potential cation channel subfamily V member 3-like [Haliotis rufescens]|uniref:transient receptor potential cation channel subfamily V member 3-like n=1 Tax=Haliotis rufescens TaxID=6454 RepID=UPI00201F92F2|nr:transient receptor potential cation channel subfamily V member 3-like [Haliotis rufescens]